MPQISSKQPADPASRRGSWRQADVRRAIAAAQGAGLEHYRVEIAPDGTIAIVVGGPPDGEFLPVHSEGL